LFNLLSIDFIRGNYRDAVRHPSCIFISERVATKYFGDSDPIGKIIRTGNASEFSVTGVFRNMPENSHFILDFIVPYRDYFQYTDNDTTNWFRNYTYTYVLLREGVDADALDKKIPDIIDKYLFENLPAHIRNEIKGPLPRIFYLQPLTEIHLHSHLRQEISANNDIKYIVLFSVIAFMTLVIACINYINLATARGEKRGKEVGIRKVAGAERKQLIFQFFCESLVITVLALLLSVVIIQIALPAFNNFVDRQLSFNPWNDPKLFAGLVVLTLLVGFMAGSYPAVRISRFAPNVIIKGVYTKNTAGLTLRNILVITQFAITIFLLISSFIVREQLDFINNYDVGYEKEQIVVIPVREKEIHRQIQTIKTELTKYEAILGVATCARLPNDIDTFTSADWPGKNPELRFTINYNTVDYDFITLFDIGLLKGRNFSKDFPSDENGAFLINEAALQASQIQSPLGHPFKHWRGDMGKIVGVIKDFNLRSLHNSIEPLYLYLDTENFSYITIKIKPTHVEETLDKIKEVIKKFSANYPFEYSFFDDLFTKAYFSEQRMMTLFNLFTLMAIILSCMGLFGLVLYTIERRVKEFGIRKVLGASATSLFILLIKEFVKWILLSNIVAWPLAWLVMSRWLEIFAYRIDLAWWPFILSAVVAVCIAIITISSQTLKAANDNPIHALKYE
ncbi:MAG: FtsX-like permease family protein, partial [Calditrichales bacterium]